ncbi:MAG: hypothetical protein IJY09_10950 [Lachnospiraceae bacterium]|nr:hypothetical protein [Lachnospiraceae bacterium]
MKKMQIIRRILCLLLVMFLLTPAVETKAEANYYTYVYDYFGEQRESPDAYTAEKVVMGIDYGIGNFNNPQGMFTTENKIYIVDTGNNRIVVLKVEEDRSISLEKEIKTFSNNGAEDSFDAPNDIYVRENGDMYICDTNNNRIVQIDKDLKLVQEIVKPVDETYDASQEFLPTKAVVDPAGRILTIAKNVNKGVMQYSPDGRFIGYIGANEVTFSMIDYIWKKLSTQAQRAQMEQFVPTEYNNIALDKDGFIYVTTSVFDEWDLLGDSAKPIRKLNSMGTDILIKNGNYPPIGDITWGNASGVSGPSKMVDITALENDTYYVVDRVRGRLFGYDSQGNLLYAFGGIGNAAGTFLYPIALDHIGYDLYVLDQRAGSLTRFKLTEYGTLINEALAAYKMGDYDLSAEYWRQVIRVNGNYDLAYIGIGRALLRQERYEEAMEYFEAKYDAENYSKAYKLWRKEWIEEHIGIFMVVLIGALVLNWGIKKIKKIKKEAMEE